MKVDSHSISFCGKPAMNLLAMSWAFFFVAAVHAQSQEPPEKISTLELPSLSGDVMVYYSEGYAERAIYLQNLMGSVSRFFQKPEVINVRLNLTLAVLDPDDWEKMTDLPYGVSHILNDSPTAVLPASGRNELSNGILKVKENASKNTLQRLEKLGISFDDAAPALSDLIGFHEIGHIYARAYGTWPEEKWLNEFIATYLAYAFMREGRPKLAELWETMCDALAEKSGHEHTSLADFERLYIGVGHDNYGWYQGKFQQMAAEVYEKSGISFVHALKQSLIENPKAAKDDPFRLKELDAIFRGFSIWAAGPDGDLKSSKPAARAFQPVKK